MSIWKFVGGLACLSSVLCGCGGSGNSNSSSAYGGTDTTATITSAIAPLQPDGYTINVAPSGVATYTISSYVITSQGSPSQQIVTKTGNGTVSAAMTTKFFQDLAAAVPVSKLPPYTGGGAVGGGSTSVTYQGQTGTIDNPSDAREAALEADNLAIAKALGIPPA